MRQRRGFRWRHSRPGIIEPDALSLLQDQCHLGRSQLPQLSGSDLLWVHRPRDRLSVDDCRCLHRGERAHRFMFPRRVRGRWKALPGPALRNRNFFSPAGIGPLVAHVPRRQKVCLFRPQATGLRIYALLAGRAAPRIRSPESTERTAWISARHPSTFRCRSRRCLWRRERVWLIDFRLLVAPV